VGFLEALAVRLVEALVRAWLRVRPVNPLRRRVREASAEGRQLLRDIQLADRGDSRALRILTNRMLKWWGDFEVALNEADQVAYERHMSPLMPKPQSLDDLARSVDEKLVVLRRIERHFAWPVPLLKFLRSESRRRL
jgi:hypothetical protein